MPKRDFRSAAPSPSCRRSAAPTTGPSSRAPGLPSPAPPSSSSPSPPPLSSCPQQHVGRGRRALCRQRRRHQRAPAQQGEELPLRSAVTPLRPGNLSRSSAAPGQRDCRAAPPEVVSSVPVGRRARRAPPPPRPWWQASDLLRCGATSLPGSLRRSSAHVEAMSGAVAAAFERLELRCQHKQSTS